MSVVGAFKLANSHWIPAVGLGTWHIPRKQLSETVQVALESGYRHFDTASIFQTADVLGDTLHRYDLPRAAIFLSYKLWPTHFKRDDVQPAVEKALKDLRTDYLDSLLLHFPNALKTEQVGQKETATPAAGGKGKSVTPKMSLQVDHEHDIGDTWAALEDLHRQGLIRTLGVSNYSIPKLEELKAKVTSVQPMINQVELHPYHPQWELLEYSRKHDIHLTAASPLGSTQGKDLRSDPVIMELAELHRRSSSQILLSWGIKRGTSVIPRSTDPHRIASNIEIVMLTDTEMEAINAIDKRHKYVHQDKSLGIEGLFD